MSIYKEVYDFAAKAGALEGYVFPREKVDSSYLPQWIDNLVNQYQHLPTEAREEFQASCNATLGRAIQSLLPLLGEDHEIIKKLRSVVSGKLPLSSHDFTFGR